MAIHGTIQSVEIPPEVLAAVMLAGVSFMPLYCIVEKVRLIIGDPPCRFRAIFRSCGLLRLVRGALR
jgi:hypothetical protein